MVTDLIIKKGDSFLQQYNYDYKLDKKIFKEVIFDGLDKNNITLLEIYIDQDQSPGKCIFSTYKYEYKIFDILSIQIDEESYYCVFVSISDDELKFKCFKKAGDARNYSKQYKDIYE
jgi:hypothetical protein